MNGLANSSMLRFTTVVLIVVSLVLLSMGTNQASAHEGEGEDVAYALLTASQANGMATVQVRILEPATCDGFEAAGLVAERLESTATGVIQAAGECGFEGAIELPDPGRWNMIVRLKSDGRIAEASMPVGVTDEASSFELETWFHAGTSDDGFLPAWLNPRALGLYAVVAIATIVLVRFVLRGRSGSRVERA